MSAHDPQVCGLDASTDCPECLQKRLAYNRAQEALYRQERLLERLGAAGIDIKDLAFIVWLELEAIMEERVTRLVNARLRNALKGIQLTSVVRGSWGD